MDQYDRAYRFVGLRLCLKTLPSLVAPSIIVPFKEYVCRGQRYRLGEEDSDYANG